MPEDPTGSAAPAEKSDLSGGSAPPAPVDRKVETLVIVGLLLALLMGALDNFVVVTALPTILTQFGQPNSGSFVVSAYIIGSTAGIPIFAKLSDLWSRRNVFLGGLVIFIVGSILSGISQNLSELIAFRAVQGFGSGDFFPVGIAIVAVIFPPETRSRIVGLLSGVFGIAVVAGPLLGSAIVDHASWRWVFYVNIPVGLIGLLIVATILGPLRPDRVRSFDVPGAALLVGWVGALMFPLYEVSDAGWKWADPRVIGLLALAVVLVAIFVLWELRTKEPLVPLRLFKQRVIATSGGATFLIGMVFFPMATFLSLIVGVVLSGGASNAADVVRDVLYALVIPVVFGAAIGGQLLPKVEYRTVAALGVVIASIGLFGLTFLTPSTPTWVLADGFLPVGGVVLPLIPLGFGIGLTFPVFLLAAQNQVATRDVGEAGGLIQFLQQLGGSIGLSVLASWEQTRFTALDPAPSAACSSLPPPLPECAVYLGKFQSATITAYVEIFEIALALMVAAFVILLFLQGRLPRGASAGPGGAI